MPFTNSYQGQDTPHTDMFGVPIDQTGEDSYGNEELAPNQGLPNNGDVQRQQQPVDNDAVRAAHWQSEHDKMKNAYEQLAREKQQLEQQYQQAPQNQPEPEVEEERFPDPPPPPVKPYNFSQREALSDPSSESAMYYGALTEYNATMNQYNALKSDYMAAKHAEDLKRVSMSEKEYRAEQERKTQTEQQVQNVIREIQSTEGVDYDTAVDFVREMSDPNSINVRNLFKLYQMNKQGQAIQGQQYQPQQPYRGIPNQQYQQQQFGSRMNNQPSQDFQQMRNAQSIPPIMGVHNAQTNTSPVDPMVAMFQEAIRKSNNNQIY